MSRCGGAVHAGTTPLSSFYLMANRVDANKYPIALQFFIKLFTARFALSDSGFKP